MSEKTIIANKYVLDRLIGVGKVAFVYKAWDNMLHKFIAVKKIHEDFAKDEKFVDKFRKEAIHTAKLEHENIVRVVNFIMEGSDYYMIMDYVNGVNLEYLLMKCQKRNIKIPPEIAVYIISEITKALEYAHSLKDGVTGEPLNIVHRDVSPGNIMLYYNGKIKLTDFGIAKAGRDSDDEAKDAESLAYMSPEQALCGEVDGRSDLFNCGLVLYEILAGEKPYSGESDIEIWKKAKSASINYKKLESAGVEKELISVIKQLLSKDPDDRYRSAAEMFVDLKKFLIKTGSTESIEKKYHKFIGSALREEMFASEQEIKKDLEKKYELDEESELPGKKEVSNKEPMRIENYFPGEESFSVIRDKKIRRVAALKVLIKVAVVFLLIGGSVYAFFGLTGGRRDPYGSGVQDADYVKKPELRLTTSPPGARVRILDQYSRNILVDMEDEPVTPLHIQEIDYGYYTIQAEKEGYGRISRRMGIQEGFDAEDADIDIENSSMLGDFFLLPFDVKISVDSRPRGAMLYINEENMGRTPYNGTHEVGIYNFRVERAGFEPSGVREPDLEDAARIRGVCVIDTSIPIEKQVGVDYRFWEISESTSTDGKQLNITGYLKRRN